jgi:hypothetical protein
MPIIYESYLDKQIEELEAGGGGSVFAWNHFEALNSLVTTPNGQAVGDWTLSDPSTGTIPSAGVTVNSGTTTKLDVAATGFYQTTLVLNLAVTNPDSVPRIVRLSDGYWMNFDQVSAFNAPVGGNTAVLSATAVGWINAGVEALNPSFMVFDTTSLVGLEVLSGYFDVVRFA